MNRVSEGDSPRYFASQSGSLVIVSDRYHSLVAYDAVAGKVAWKRKLGGPIQFDIVGGKLFAFHSPTYLALRPFLACLDPMTGQVLWQRNAPEGECWGKMAVFESSVHVLAADRTTDSKNIVFDHLVSWTHDGDPLPSPPPDPADAGKQYQELDIYTMRVDGEAYSFRRPPNTWTLPQYRFTREECEKLGLSGSDSLREQGTQLDGGGVFAISSALPGIGRSTTNSIGRSIPSAARGQGDFGRYFHFLDGDNFWTGKPWYLNERSGVTAWDEAYYGNFLDTVASDERHVVVATTFGQMECLDRATGVSRWVYVYPTWRREFSAPNQWPFLIALSGSYLSRLRNYERETSGVGVAGTTLCGDGIAGRRDAFTVVADPQPTHWYWSYSKTLAFMLITLWIVPCAALALIAPGAIRLLVGIGRVRGGPAGGAVPSRSGRQYLPLIPCAFIFYLMMNRGNPISPLFLLPVEMIVYSIICVVVYQEFAVEENGEKTRRAAGILTAALFFPFVLWSAYGLALL